MEKEKQEDKGKSAGVYGMISDKDDSFRNSGKKQNEWSEVLKMTGYRDTNVRRHAADLLSLTFQKTEEKSGVFFDLVRLTESKDAYIRERAAELLFAAFVNSDNKQNSWDELVRLASVEDRRVREGAILALSSGYVEVPDKEKAWEDLIRLSVHSDNFVKRITTRALGAAFFYVPDKTHAWRDLQSLTNNPYVYVRLYAFRALGKASLWRALSAENEATYIFGLKEAVKYFKEAAETFVDFHIHDFYQPFYEALLFILFSERPGIERLESERFLSKMIEEVRGRNENPGLLEIFRQLADILKRAGNLTSGDLSEQKKLLEASILIFNNNSSLFEIEEDKTILAQKTLKKEKIVNKGYSKLGKDLLERVEEKKPSFIKKP